MTDAARLTWLASLSTGAMFMNFCLITGIFQISLLRLWRTVNNVVGHARRPCAHLIRCIHSSDAGCTGPAEPKTEASSPHTKSSRLNVGRCVGLICTNNFLLDAMFMSISLASRAVPSHTPQMLHLTKALLSGTRTNGTVCTLWFAVNLYRSTGGNRLFTCCGDGCSRKCKQEAIQSVSVCNQATKSRSPLSGICFCSATSNKPTKCKLLIYVSAAFHIFAHSILVLFITDHKWMGRYKKLRDTFIRLPTVSENRTTDSEVDDSFILSIWWGVLILCDILLILVIIVLLCCIHQWIAFARKHLSPSDRWFGTNEPSRKVGPGSLPSMTMVAVTSGNSSHGLRSIASYPNYDRAITTMRLLIFKAIFTALPIVTVEILSISHWITVSKTRVTVFIFVDFGGFHSVKAITNCMHDRI